MFKGKVLLIAGGTCTFRRKFSESVLKRYPEMSKMVFLIGNRQEFEKEKERNSNPLITIRQGNFLVKKNLLQNLEGVDYLLNAANIEDNDYLYKTKKSVRNKILGTQNLVEAALARGIKKVISLSSDKACNPTDLAGALSLCAEKLAIAGNTVTCQGGKETCFSVVRLSAMAQTMYTDIAQHFASRDKGCLAITDMLATRFWITPEEGMSFILKSFVKMEGGETFVPKVPSISFKKLTQIICPDCQIKEAGLKPGERLHEILISAADDANTLDYNDYYVIQPEGAWWNIKGYAERTGGREVAAGFNYSSDTNPWSLSGEELEFLIKRTMSRAIAAARTI